MAKNLCALVVFLCVVSGVSTGWAGASSDRPVGVQNQSYQSIDGGKSGPSIDETVTIDLFWNRVAMFKFDAERGEAAVLVITRLTPDKSISGGFVGLNNSLIRLDDFLTGPDTVLVRDVMLDKNNHVFVHVFGEPGAALRVQVLPPLPTVTGFTVTPTSVIAGRSAMLAWSTVQAETVVIEPDIGVVAPAGSLAVTPEASTRYTLTAQNRYGSTSVSAWLEVVHPPTVFLSADPPAIAAGGSATLSWSSTGADTCHIEPGVGDVAANGTVTITPAATTVYTITASGRGGTATDSVTVRVDCPLTITIDSPAEGAGLSGPSVTVTGTVIHAGNMETGVVVNGVPAIISDGRFRADHVALTDGENLITATATDANGITADASVTVHADASANYLCLTADPVQGIPPFEVSLHIYGSFDIASSNLTHDGPDTAEVVESGDDEYRIRINTEGVYTFTATVTDDRGDVYRDSVAIAAINEAALDALLQGKWEGMKAALATGNVNRAIGYFADSSRKSFNQQFTALSSVLPQIAGDMGGIRLEKFQGNRAVYDLRSALNGKMYSFQVLFVLDRDGLWHIKSF